MGLNVEKLRNDFTILSKTINKKPIIYMDSACMSLKPKCVVDKITEYYNEYPACSGRSAHKLAKKVEDEVHDARKEISKFICASKQEEIVFTRNTTEGINLVSNSLGLKKGDNVLTSDKEHNSGLIPFQILAKKGISHNVFTFSNVEDFKKKLTKNTKLVSFVMTSNVDGTTQPVREMIRIAHDNGSLVLLDGAQHVPHEETNVKKLDCDFLAFSGHKMCGPTGTGILYGKMDCLKKLDQFMVGGETVKNSTYTSFEPEDIPMKFEAGLQDYAGILGLSEAAKYLKKVGLDNIKSHEQKLSKFIYDELISNCNNEIILLGDGKNGVISFNVKGLNYHEVSGILNETKNIMVRSGMHCVHSWFNKNKLPGSVRASLYFYNTKEECDILIEEVKKVCEFGK
ncbi:MAG: cysteine desulfurase [Candidatus Woesearchaeota archaeon]|jgi:cysteine desulfurase/selenocysteine lyase